MTNPSTSFLSPRSIFMATIIMLLTQQCVMFFFGKSSWTKTLPTDMSGITAAEETMLSIIKQQLPTSKDSLDLIGEEQPLMIGDATHKTNDRNTTSSNEPVETSTSSSKSISLGHYKDANVTLTDDAIQQLPTNKELLDLIGEEALMIGEGTQCLEFHRLVPDAKKRWIGVAGLFNAGTNLLYSLLENNCVMPGGPLQIRWQVPWGKHGYAAYTNHTVRNDRAIIKENGLAIVVARHPYPWALSMCKKPYAIKWNYTKFNCPNLKYGKLVPWAGRKHENLMHFWNGWYREYVKQFPYPRIIVKSEDLTLRPREITKKICECGGGKLAEGKFIHSIEGRNPNSNTNMIKAWEKIFMFSRDPYGGLSFEEHQVAKQALDRELMKSFGYDL